MQARTAVSCAEISLISSLSLVNFEPTYFSLPILAYLFWPIYAAFWAKDYRADPYHQLNLG